MTLTQTQPSAIKKLGGKSPPSASPVSPGLLGILIAISAGSDLRTQRVPGPCGVRLIALVKKA